MRPVGARAAIAVVAAVMAVAAPIAEGKTRQSVSLALTGGSAQRVDACGGGRSATVVPRGARPRAAVRLAEPGGLRWGGRSTRLVVDRCEDGRWRRVSARGFGTRGPYRRVRGFSLPLPAAASADLRVRATVAGDRHRRGARSPARYLRVGVGELVDLPVSFDVENLNRTTVPCQTDGRRYTIAGHLMAPRSALERPDRAITVFLHGLEISDAYFRYRGVPGYDFHGEMAELGHASIVVDRLGHGESSLPPGEQSCVGGQADIAHQVIDRTRAGDFRLGQGRGRAFRKVALAGHSFGSYMAELSAMNFGNQDALVLMAFAAEGLDPTVLGNATARGESLRCGSGGLAKHDGGPGGYAFLWPDRDTWAGDTYFNAEPRVVEDAKGMRERSPCGDLTSAIPGGGTQPAQYSRVTTPVLLVFARQDAVFPPPAGQNHRDRYTGSSDVTLHEIENAGHTLMLQRTAPEFRAKLSDWLEARGY
jgi:pimeloyl-ACP methyl ester carboxylesterase